MVNNEDWERRAKFIKEAEENLKGYRDLLSSIENLKQNINYVEQRAAELDAERLDAIDKLNRYNRGILKLDKADVDELKKKIPALKLALQEQEKILKGARRELELREQAFETVSKTNVALNTMKHIGKGIGNQILKTSGYWLDQQKAVKETELSMGILSNQAKGFRANIFTTSQSTLQMGVSTRELAKMQGTYADNVGRAVQLNEEQLEAVAQIGAGTMLGTEAAAEMASQFELIGMGAESTRDFVDETLQLATKMGTSSSKTIKNIQNNFRLLNKYNFKGGVDGFGKMAALATKFRVEMESIAGFADDLMTPEGAVEVASKLQVLGGEWAKLGDPFELMFRSRNDLGGLTEDIINATKATATFDETTGEFRISPMELSRLREVANLTGMSAEELAEMAKQTAKFDRIESLIPATFSEEDKNYMSSLAQFNKKTGQFEIALNVPGQGLVTESITSLSKITPDLIKSQKKFQQSLEDRAKQSLTFTERFENLVDIFKSTLLPGFDAFTTGLENSIGKFQDWAEDEGMLEKLTDFGTKIGEFAASVVKFVTDNPIASIVGVLIGKAALWYARGVQLGLGFNSVTGGGGLGKLFGGGKNRMVKSKSGKMYPANSPQGKMISNMTGKKPGMLGKLGKLSKLGKVGGILGGASVAFDGYNNFTDDDLTGGEALLKTLDQNLFTGIGLALAPFTGGLSLLAGGAIDAARGFGDHTFGDWDSKGMNKPSGPFDSFDDFIIRPNSQPVAFSSDDTVVGAKKDGPLDRMLSKVEATPGNNDGGLGGNEGLNIIKEMSKSERVVEPSSPTNTDNSGMSLKFEDSLKIEGKIQVDSGTQTREISLDDPILMQNLSKMIMEELSKAIGGGKLSSNPVPA
jgi:hypothetical protein